MNYFIAASITMNSIRAILLKNHLKDRKYPSFEELGKVDCYRMQDFLSRPWKVHSASETE
jgi:hypothetical protein